MQKWEAQSLPISVSKNLVEFRRARRKKCQSVLSGGVYVGQNTLHNASVEFVRKLRTNYARSIVQSFSNGKLIFRLSACQKYVFDKHKWEAHRFPFQSFIPLLSAYSTESAPPDTGWQTPPQPTPHPQCAHQALPPPTQRTVLRPQARLWHRRA